MSTSPVIKKKNWLLYSLIGALLLLGAIAVYKSNQKPKGAAITIATVEKKSIKETVSASGKIFPETEIKISSDVSGEIVALYVKEGDSVIVGQVLAKIDPDTYVSAVERGEASLNSTKSQLAVSKAQIENNKAQRDQIVAQVENARTINKRNEILKKDGVISQAELDQSITSLRQLEANLKSADASIRSAFQSAEAASYSINASNASLKELKTSLDRTTIRAPQSGIVSKLAVEKGERVVGTAQMTGTEMMRISNLNAMEVQVNVSENDILKVKLNHEATIEVDAYLGKKFKGVVTHIANSAANISSLSSGGAISTDQVTNFVVKIRILESSYADIRTESQRYPLRPGMSASVDIYTQQIDNELVVPIQCVTVRDKKDLENPKDTKKSTDDISDEADTKITDEEDDYQELVFVMTDDTVRVAKVVTGIQDNENIHIKSGLNVGDKVISGPYSEVSKNLKQGDKVRIKEEKTDKK